MGFVGVDRLVHLLYLRVRGDGLSFAVVHGEQVLLHAGPSFSLAGSSGLFICVHEQEPPQSTPGRRYSPWPDPAPSQPMPRPGTGRALHLRREHVAAGSRPPPARLFTSRAPPACPATPPPH